ncbi:hypothetical protein GCM10010472_06210 [Pseudonocardia halophobica]|uniref:Uncharacterized protein n=1 Tax=Pseudonocardia halophobica TaxID=29401 RepID=A0A9W6NVB6_9PSEU|nr:hypothetical protein [Pseudonocardia halophobica]GLL10242.1 hypothetical protein GCM10017577_13820 [Pseudonocardia halophobica]
MTGGVPGVPALVAGLCDDAAVFPPGLAPLPDAVRAYRDRRDRWYAGLVGPLVLAAAVLPQLGPLLPPDARLPLSVTLPGGPADLPAALADAAALPVELRSVEVAVPEGMATAEFLDLLAARVPGALDVYVEVPRDLRRVAVLEVLASSSLRYRAKFRTGGIRADLHPDEAELAAGVAAVVGAGVPFKATAGLHHAVRNTDPRTGFEQHGFLNLLLATDALVRGGTESEARALLAERDGATVAGLVRTVEPGVRAAFASFGTCSITEPRDELVALGVLTAPVPEGIH